MSLLRFAALAMLGLMSRAQGDLTETSTVTAKDGAIGDRFGFSVASSNHLVVAGATMTDGPSVPNHGSAYLYDCASLPCTPLAKLSASDPGSLDLFGASVAISGDKVVVGSPYDDSPGVSNHGSAYVFSCNQTGCFQVAKLTPPSPLTANLEFGVSVAISGSLVAVGAPSASSKSGAVHLFDCSSASPALPGCLRLSTLSAPAGTPAGCFFGASLAFDDVTSDLVVGAPYTTVGTNRNQGAAHVFSCSSSACTLGSTLTAAAGDRLNFFGTSVAKSAHAVVIGADWATLSGAAYLFACSSASSCAEVATLTAPDGLAADHFGSAVAVNDTLVAVGAYAHDAPSATAAGAVYLFDCAGLSSCSFSNKLVASSPAPSDWLGSSVTMLGWQVVAGAPYSDAPARDQGSLMIFDPTSAICGCSSLGSEETSCGYDRQCKCLSGFTGLKCDQAL